MDRLFRIDFYPQDWLIDTSRLTPEERGIFIQIICLIYANRGPIETNPAWIAGVCGCSARTVKKVVDNLVNKSFLQITTDLKLTQKRVEKELILARDRHEQSAKGGRAKAEKEAKLKQNNDLNSAAHDAQLNAPSQPHLIPSKQEPPLPPADPPNPKPPASGAGALKNFSGGAGLGAAPASSIRFRIEGLLSDEAREKAKAKAKALNRDFYSLCSIYDEGVNNGTREAPRSPDGAFLKWIPAYTKNERL